MKTTMFRSFMLILMIVLAAPISGWGQTEGSQGFTIAGEIQFSKTGDLYLFLYTEAELEESRKDDKKDDDKKGEKFPGHTLHIEIGEEELNAKKVAFTLENVPAGTYCIFVDLDVNDNGKLDWGMFGPKEPWGNYRRNRPRMSKPKFKDMAFDVNADLTDLVIKVE